VSEEHVQAVFGPPWVRDNLDFYRERYYQAEGTIVRLRHALRKSDPSLPDACDGRAWQKIEEQLLDPRGGAIVSPDWNLTP